MDRKELEWPTGWPDLSALDSIGSIGHGRPTFCQTVRLLASLQQVISIEEN